MDISVNVKPTLEEVKAGKVDLQDGFVLKILNDGKTPEYEIIQQPALAIGVSLLQEEIGQATDKSLMKLLEIIIGLIGGMPRLSGLTLFEVLREGLPWQMELLRSCIELGLPIDESTFPANTKPQINISFNPNFTMPVTMPEQAPPVVNLAPTIRNELPVETVEEIDIKRDGSGFIESATKHRRKVAST